LAISNEKISAFLKEKLYKSMSEKNCLDNAENFFGILKSELFYLKKYIIRQLKNK
jgi:putative transposase